jgi:hypothetical protein
MTHTNLLFAGALLLGVCGAVETAAVGSNSSTVEWNGKRILCTAKGDGARARVEPTPQECRVHLEFGEGITHSVVIKPDELLITSRALGIEKPQKREFSGGVRISLDATRDSLTVEILEQHSSSHSSESTSSRSRDGSGSSTIRSSSTSTSRSSEVKFFKILRWNQKRVEISLDAGKSVKCDVVQDGQQCTINFDIDAGKNKRTLILGPKRLTIHGKPQELGDYAALLITATRRGLKVQTDKGIVGHWQGDMDRRVLTDGLPK